MTDTEIKLQGLVALVVSLGEVRAERFISLIIREPFDHTQWQKKSWTDQTVEELSQLAMKNRKSTQDE